MDMTIYILGDIDFSYRILLGVTMLYQDSAMHLMAATLLILFVLWSFIKWSLNPEKSPYPFKEFAFGIIFYMIFGGLDAISPRFDVRLETDVYQGAAFQTRTIADVPLLAAVPAWLATNLFKGIRETISPILVIPGTNIYPGMSQGIDPLTLLVKLNDMSYQVNINPALAQTVSEYATNCYIPYHESGSNPTGNTVDNLMKQSVANFWSAAEVDVNWMFSKQYTGGNGIERTCKEVFDYVASQQATHSGQIQNHLTASNIQGTDISTATELIMSSLTGGTSPDPYAFMQGKFLASYFAQGISISDVPKMKVWADKMMFEASQKRLVERAGESNLFTQIMVPMITAIEAFAFFIAPVLMLLTVMGGVGISYIGKYLMLTLFINMWSFIKIFTDFFMLLTVHKGINGNLAVNDNYNPFSVVNQSGTFLELESYLTVASSLTSALPLFAMFLLYGGVHSMMGVMRSMQSGTVDASNMAPTLGTSMNNGNSQMGDQNYQKAASTGFGNRGTDHNTNAAFGNQSVQQTLGAANTRELQQATATLNSSANSVVTSLNEMFTVGDQTTTGDNTSDSQNISTSAASNRVNNFADAVNAAYQEKTGEQANVTSRFAAGLALSIGSGKHGLGKDFDKMTDVEQKSAIRVAANDVAKGMGFSGDVSALLAATYQQDNGAALQEGVSQALSFAKSDQSGAAYSNGLDWSKVDSSTQTAAQQEASQKVDSNTQTYSKQSSTVNSARDALTKSNAFTSNRQLPWTLASGKVDGLGGLNWVQSTLKGQGFTNDDREAIIDRYNSAQSKGQTGAPLDRNIALANAINKAAAAPGNNYKATQTMQSLADDLISIEQYGAAASIYRVMAPMSGTGGVGFMNAAEHAEKLQAMDNLTKPIETHQSTASQDLTGNTLAEQRLAVQNKSEKRQAKTDAKISSNANQIQSDAKSLNLTGEDGKPLTQVNSIGNDLGLTNQGRAQELIDGLNTDASIMREQPNHLDSAGALKAAVGGASFLKEATADIGGVLTGNDQSWGQNSQQWAGVATATAAKLGLDTGGIRPGLENLYSFGAAEFKQLEEQAASGDVKALQTLSNMNDAALFLTNSGDVGSSILKSMDKEQESRTLMAVAKTEELIGHDNGKGIGGISTAQFNEISAQRLNGTITDDNADTLIAMQAKSDQGFSFTGGLDILTGAYNAVAGPGDAFKSTIYSAANGAISENSILMGMVSNSKSEIDGINPSAAVQSISGISGSELSIEYGNANTRDTVKDIMSNVISSNALAYDNNNLVSGVNLKTLDEAQSSKVLNSYVDTILERDPENNGQFVADYKSLNDNIVSMSLKETESLVGDGKKPDFDLASSIGVFGMVSAFQGLSSNVSAEFNKDRSFGEQFSTIQSVSPGLWGSLTNDQNQTNATSLAFIAASTQTPQIQAQFERLGGQDGERVREALYDLGSDALDKSVLIDRATFGNETTQPREGFGDITSQDTTTLDQSNRDKQ